MHNPVQGGVIHETYTKPFGQDSRLEIRAHCFFYAFKGSLSKDRQVCFRATTWRHTYISREKSDRLDISGDKTVETDSARRKKPEKKILRHPQDAGSQQLAPRAGGVAANQPEGDGKNKRGRRITSEVLAARSIEEILHVVDGYLGNPAFNVINAVTATYRISKQLVSQPHGSARQAFVSKHPTMLRLAAHLEERIEEFGGYSLCNVAWACRNMELGSPNFLPKLQARFCQVLPNMAAKEVCGTLAAFAKCGQMTNRSLKLISPHLLRWIRPVKGMSMRCLHGLTWSYARAAAQLGPCDKAVLAEIARLVKSSHEETTQIDLANLVWAFAKLEMEDAELFDVLAARACKILRRGPGQSGDLDQQQVQDLCNFAWGFGKAFGNVAAATPSLGGRVDAQIDFFMRLKPVRQKVFQRLAERLPELKSHLDPVGYSSLICGFANARYYNREAMELLSSGILSLSGRVSFQAVAVTLWAYSILKHDDPKVFEAMAARGVQILRENEEASGQAITMIIIACANLDISHLPNCGKLINALTRLVNTDIRLLKTTQSLANTAWGLACLNRLSASTLDRICLRASDIGDSCTAALSQVYMADMAIRIEQERTSAGTAICNGDREQFTDEQHERITEIKGLAKKFWIDRLKGDFTSITGFHWNVANILQQAGGSFQLEYVAEDFPLDIVIVEDKIAIEVDGPCHFTRNSRRPLGYNTFKQRMLSQRGWRVVHVAYFDWNQLPTLEEKQQYLLDLLSTVGWKVPKNRIDERL